MKKLKSLLLLILASLALFSQEIVDSEKVWSNMEEHCHSWGSTYSTDFFKFDKDTIIDNITYKKVWISEDEDHANWNFYGAFIREENKRVYYKQYVGDEGLIYDFNLTIGDSVLVDNPISAGEIWLILVSIDSIQTNDGYKERWELKNNGYPDSEYWIRGIGSQNGVLNSSTGIYGGLCGLYTLLCEKENGDVVYINPDFQTCYLYTVGKDELTNESKVIRITDSPYNNNITVSTDIEGHKQYVITDLGGKTISNVNTIDKSISVSIIDKGIYIISIFTEGNRYSKKFIRY